MDCIRCNKPIPPARLEAVPGTAFCAPCKEATGDEPPRLGRMRFDHKTGGELEIVSKETLQELTRLDRRGYKRAIKKTP